MSKQDIDQLTALVKTRLTQMQYRPGLIDGFVAKTGLDLEPVTPAIKDLIHAEFRS